MKKQCLVLGSSGFIGKHLVEYLVRHGHHVTGIDRHEPDDFGRPHEFIQGDLTDYSVLEKGLDPQPNEIYHLAAEMGGAGYVFTGYNDADIMMNSLSITMNVINACRGLSGVKLFYSSSACVYPEHHQMHTRDVTCAEHTAYPANPDSEYGWEKLMGERMLAAAQRNYGLNVRIARLHNVFGKYGAWTGGREKAPAAICRKVAEAMSGDSIEVWGTGEQARSFLHVDQCIEGIVRIMNSDYTQPLNLGSEEMITVNQLAGLVADIAKKQVYIRNVPGPVGVNARCSDNTLIREELNWSPKENLREGLVSQYEWITDKVREGMAASCDSHDQELSQEELMKNRMEELRKRDPFVYR